MEFKKNKKMSKSKQRKLVRNPKVSVNSRLKAIQIIGERKALCGQRIPEFSYARKETVDTDILLTSMYGDRIIMQYIRILSGSSYQKKKAETVQPVKINIYQSNTYKNNLSWQHFLLHQCFCNLSSTSKQQLRGPAQT